jgi:RimJ/RimL family protein N-acetyltransferase
MPFLNIAQPDIIEIDEKLRLKKVCKDDYHLALKWYQNPRVLYYSEGVTDNLYDMNVINRMYEFLNGMGELYFIEVFEDKWHAIGDVVLSEDNMPIVIGEDRYSGIGIGKKVIATLIVRAKVIGLEKIKIPAIYKYNDRSRNLFLSFGFTKVAENDNEESYELNLLG